MEQYQNLLRKILENGKIREDRTGVGTQSIFGEMLMFDLRKGFPLVTSKKTFFKGCKMELKWLLSGETNIKYLKDNDIHIWDAWADASGELGPVYGSQWRSWGGRGIDQIQNMINEIRQNPTSRRLVVSAWNAIDLPKMHLPPCHMFFQVYVDGDELDMMVYQRSADMFLGVPFDIAEYALLLEIISRCTGKKARYLKYTFGDTHIYLNHIEQVKELLTRKPKPLPFIEFTNEIHEISDYDPDKVKLINYDPYPTIKAPVAV